MLEQILRWAARALAGILEKYGDPDLQAKLDAFNAKVAAVEAKEKEAEQLALQSEAAYLASVEKRKEFDRLLGESLKQEMASRERLAASQTRVKEIEDEAKKLKQNIDSRPDADVLRDRL